MQGVRVGSLLQLGVLVASCSSSTPRQLSPSTTDVVPFQAVALDDAAASFQSTMYTATLGSDALTVVRVSPTRLAMVTPELPAGRYALAVSADGVSYVAVTFQIGDAPVVADPAGTVHDYLDSATAELAMLQMSASGDATYLPIYQAMAANLRRFRMEFDALDAADQARAAGFVAANPVVAARGYWSSWNVSTVSQWIVVGVEIGGVVGGLITGQPWLSIAAGAMLMRDGAQLADSYATGTGQVFEDAAGSGSVGDVAPYELVVLQFSDGQPATVPLTVSLKNVTASDLSSPAAASRNAAAALDGFVRAWPSFDAAMNPHIPPPPALSSIQEVVQDVSVDGSAIQISNVSGGVMLVGNTPTSTGATLTFTSAACQGSSANISFAFTATYSEMDFPDQRSTIQAILGCGCKNVSSMGSAPGPYPRCASGDACINTGLMVKTCTDTAVGYTATCCPP